MEILIHESRTLISNSVVGLTLNHVFQMLHLVDVCLMFNINAMHFCIVLER